jgi:hypothetical protein
MYTAHRHYRPEEKLDDHFDIDVVFASRWKFNEKFQREYVALPVYMYDHSGQTVSTRPFSCPWDSGLFGIIAVEVDKVKEQYGWKNLTKSRRKTIEQHLRKEVETYDDYLTGQVYGYLITSINDEENVLDSCWEYYGDSGLKDIEAECKRHSPKGSHPARD